MNRPHESNGIRFLRKMEPYQSLGFEALCLPLFKVNLFLLVLVTRLGTFLFLIIIFYFFPLCDFSLIAQ